MGVVKGVQDVAADVARYAGSEGKELDIGGRWKGEGVTYRKVLGAMVIDGEARAFAVCEGMSEVS